MKLPEVLTQEEICDIIKAPHRLILMTVYSAGLQASEVTALMPEHIDSKRMLIKVEGSRSPQDLVLLTAMRLRHERNSAEV